jgi:hypothetical protein
MNIGAVRQTIVLELVEMLPDSKRLFFSLLESQYFLKFKATQAFRMNFIGLNDAVTFAVLKGVTLELVLTR